MRKLLAAGAVISIMLGAVACSSSGSTADPTPQPATPSSPAVSSPATSPSAAPPSAPAAAPVLSGKWKQSNSKSDDAYQAATITGDAIEINWVTDGGDSTSLYWAGTFVAPTAAGEYSWDSANDTSKTESAMLASGDPTKTFTYADGVISYSVSALGTTMKVKLQKEK